ncbi:hypothetical protein SVIOM342S_01809 [Streptomyces violaceorubidus]
MTVSQAPVTAGLAATDDIGWAVRLLAAAQPTSTATRSCCAGGRGRRTRSVPPSHPCRARPG